MPTSTLGIVTKAVGLDLFSASTEIKKALKPFLASIKLNGEARVRSRASVEIGDSKSLVILFDVNDPKGDSDPSPDKHPKLHRTLYVFFGCQSDHPEFGDDHISLSIGCWGDSADIVSAVAKALSKAAGNGSQAYVLANDCSNEQFKLMA